MVLVVRVLFVSVRRKLSSTLATPGRFFTCATALLGIGVAVA